MSRTNVQDSLHHEYSVNAKYEDATARFVGEEVYQTKCVCMGAPYLFEKEKFSTWEFCTDYRKTNSL